MLFEQSLRRRNTTELKLPLQTESSGEEQRRRKKGINDGGKEDGDRLRQGQGDEGTRGSRHDLDPRPGSVASSIQLGLDGATVPSSSAKKIRGSSLRSAMAPWSLELALLGLAVSLLRFGVCFPIRPCQSSIHPLIQLLHPQDNRHAGPCRLPAAV